MEEEYELTFLVRSVPEDVLTSRSSEIIDVYIPISAAHPIVRIRKSGGKYAITKKQPINEGDASHQIENTIPLTEKEFDALNKVEGKRVRKIRYYYTKGEFGYEIDVFQDELLGLVVADVEFNSNEEKSKFNKPDWFLADVTQEDFIAGGMLCGKSYEDIQDHLDRFQYKQIKL